MDHIKILKRAWNITWSYRALWVFGIMLALVTASGSPGPGGNGGDGQVQYELNGDEFFGPRGEFPWPGGEFRLPDIGPEIVGILSAVGIALACVVVLLIIVSVVARYVAETSLIRMVGDYEETGEKHSVRQGFRLGWSRTAWRLFLINLVVVLPAVVVFILLFFLAGAPLLAWITKSTALRVGGTVAAVGLFVVIVLLAIVVGTLLSLLLRLFRRACVLEGLGVGESIQRGFGLMRRHLLDVGLMWLLMVGVRIALAIGTIIAVILLIPAIIVLIVLGGVLGGLPALLVGGLASLFVEGAVPWILGALIGIPIFAFVVGLPWLFLNGLVEVFKSSVWTLTYRELLALEGLEQAEAETGPDAPVESEPSSLA